MAKGKLILICHSGGDFVTNDDGTMSYNGGEANAENVTNETPFNDIKLKLAEACDLDHKTVTIKYFLPGNKKNLIVMKNDKDVKRMIDFHGDAITAEVFVMGAPGFDRTILDIESNRESGGKKDDSLKKDETAKVKNSNAKKTKKDGKVTTSPAYDTPAKRTRRALAAAAADVASDNNKKGGSDKSGEDSGKSGGAMSEDSGDETSGSSDSDRGNDKPGSNSDSGSDFVPKRSSIRKRNNTSTASPADSVKKRRRTPSWKFGANGRPTIVSFPDTGAKPEKTPESRSSQRKSSRLAAKGDSSSRERKQRKEKDSDQESEKSEEKLSLAVCDDYALPETMVDAWQSAITGVGQEFDSVNEFRAALKKYAIANRFGYKFKKNDTSRAIGRCAAEGCTWKFYAAWVPTNQSFMIKTMTNSHSCDKESRKSAHPAKNWLVGTIKDRLKESPYLKPKEIANGILQDFGVELNYTQVWRGIGDAREQLHGSLKESYNKLPWFCEKVLETNPGSVAKLVVGDKKRFKSLFVCFHALIHGFKNGCRPLLFLESASMKSRYGETLLTAIAIDGNDGFIPVAFAVVDVEDDDTWRWFLEELKGSIMDLRPITFVVDRDKNLKKIVVEVFENAYIGYSIHHLLASFKRHMKGPFHGDGKAFLGVHLLAAAQAVRPIGFKKSTEHIKSISSQAHDWVVKIEPENYASPYFKGERYNHITEDVGETYTKLMEEYRHLPILQKIDALIRTMIDDVEDAKIDGTMWASKLTALKEKELEIEKGRARGLKVLISSDVIFEVREECTHVVNVGDWSCTCMGWKETGLPCRHAVAVLTLTGKNPYDFCSSYFTADAYRLTYAESICPVPLDGPPPLQIKTGRKWIVEGEKMEVQKVEGVEKEEGRKLDVEKDGGGSVDIEMEEGVKLDDDKKDEGSKVETEKDEGSIVETGKDEGSIVETEKDEGSIVETEKDEGSKVETEKDEGSKVEARKDEGSKVEGEKDEGSKVEGEKDEGSKVETGKDEGSKVESEKDEGRKVDTEKDEGSNVDAEKDEGRKLDVEKDEGSKVETEKDDGDKVETGKDEGSKVESEKDDGSKVETGEEEGGKSDVEKDDGGNVDTEMEEVTTLDGKKDEGAKVESEKDEGSKVESEKEEGNKVETEKEEGEKLDVEKDGGVNVDTEMEESMKLDDKKDEGSKVDTEKDEGKMVLAKYEGGKLEVEKDEGKIREEHEDPNVFVLPPIPVKGPSMVKKEIEGVETEAEMKRKVTCSKCKQTGHYKKSCKI